ncbi:MAG: CotH kinase family protein [Oscillospiraceae bacterium]|nr:CotH kinase family protein [Oscillospiraceae bacterium]
MTKSILRKTLKTIVTTVTLFALMLSMVGVLPFNMAPVVGDDLDLVGSAYAGESENENDDDDDAKRPRFRVPGTDTNVPAGFYATAPQVEVKLHPDQIAEGGWEIIWTSTNTSAEWSGGFQWPHMEAEWALSKNTGATLKRHDGGVDPVGFAWVKPGETCKGQDYDKNGVATTCGREGPAWCHEAYNFQWAGAAGQRVRRAPATGYTFTAADMARANYPRVNTSAVYVFTVAAAAYKASTGEVSDVRYRSFVIGNHTARQWAQNDFLVYSIYADASLMYDWGGIVDGKSNPGIMIPGNDREEMTQALLTLGKMAATCRNPCAPAENGPTPNPCRDCAYNYDDAIVYQEKYPVTFPNNFNRSGAGSEVPANVEIFDPSIQAVEDQRVVNQRAGLRVKGGWSRGTYAYEQRTFELYARDRYGDRSNFLHPLFGQVNSQDGNLMHRYVRFRVRNGGTDREQLYTRDEICYQMARESGAMVLYSTRPAVVYLNGAYYGMTIMRTSRTANHLQRIYGARRNGFHEIGSNERATVGCFSTGCNRVILPAKEGAGNNPMVCGEVVSSVVQLCNRPDCQAFWSGQDPMCEGFTENTLSTGGPAPACRATRERVGGPSGGKMEVGRLEVPWSGGSWREVRHLIGNSGAFNGGIDFPSGGITESNPIGLTCDKRWERFKEIVDIENLAHYYAMQMFGANVDWPQNNINLWRYWPTEEEQQMIAKGEMNEHLDGKWRFIFHDMEYGWGLYQNGYQASATHASSNTIHALLNRTGTQVHTPGDRPWRGEYELKVDDNRYHFNAANNTFMMRALLRHGGDKVTGEMRARIANAFADMMGGALTPQNMKKIADKHLKQIENEHKHMVMPAVTTGGTINAITYTQRAGGGERRMSELPRGGHGFAHTTWDGPGAPTDVDRMVPLYPYWTNADRPAFWEPQSGGTIPAGTDPDSSLSGTGPLAARGQLFNFMENRGTRIQAIMGMPVGAPDTPTSTTTENGLGIAWSSGATGTATVSGNGYAQVNTRIIGMRGLPNDDPRSAKSFSFRHFANPNNANDAVITIRTYPDPGYTANVTGATQDAQNPHLWYRVPSAEAINITFTKDNAYSQIHISAVQAKADGAQGNWFEVTNNSGRTLSTKGLYLSDNWNQEDEDDSTLPQDRPFDMKWRMPALILRPGQTVLVRTSANRTPPASDALKWSEANFNISFGERLRLARTTPDGSGNATYAVGGTAMPGFVEVMQRVEISLMTNQQMQYRGMVGGEDDNNWRIVSYPGTRKQGPAVG